MDVLSSSASETPASPRSTGASWISVTTPCRRKVCCSHTAKRCTCSSTWLGWGGNTSIRVMKYYDYILRTEPASASLQRVDPKLENWARYDSSRAIRDLINHHQHHPSERRSTYRTEHTSPEFNGSSLQASGRQTQWHQHDILTGNTHRSCPCGHSNNRLRSKGHCGHRLCEDCTQPQ